MEEASTNFIPTISWLFYLNPDAKNHLTADKNSESIQLILFEIIRIWQRCVTHWLLQSKNYLFGEKYYIFVWFRQLIIFKLFLAFFRSTIKIRDFLILCYKKNKRRWSLTEGKWMQNLWFKTQIGMLSIVLKLAIYYYERFDYILEIWLKKTLICYWICYKKAFEKNT